MQGKTIKQGAGVGEKMEYKKRLSIYTDGAARGNPGKAGVGAVIKNNDDTIAEISFYLGTATNNVAEYRAFIAGIDEAAKQGADFASFYCDSELIVKQVKGLYRVKDEKLKPLFDEAKQKLSFFKAYEITHIPRHKNSDADRLANKAIDGLAT